MFFQPPDEQSQSITVQSDSRRRRKKKNSNKKKRIHSFKRKQTKLANTMSSWADSFITAATWQMQHQVAYWKSKARALEYENRILHEIIRKNTSCTTTDNSKPEVLLNTDFTIENEEYEEHEEDNESEKDDNFEVSEEFIQFLKENAKYKEDARKERERLKASNREETNEILERSPVKTEDSIEKFKEMYGKDWQRIAALEMCSQCDFIENVDKYKPTYWPNLPLNFNFS